jgi:hypothetical protein
MSVLLQRDATESGEAPRNFAQMKQPKPNEKIAALEVDRHKVVEAILFLLDNFVGFSQYDIVKTLFLADKSHLKKYGRPITFDTYFAMENGPVPSFAYNILKLDFDFKKEFGEERPWVSVPVPNKPNVNKFVGVKRQPRYGVLSQTDTETLREAGGTIQLLDFDQVRRLTHEDPAYKEAWARRGDAKTAQMKVQLLGASDKLVDDLIYISKHVA